MKPFVIVDGGCLGEASKDSYMKPFVVVGGGCFGEHQRFHA